MASDPRAALEALLDACDGCGCLGETHAHRAEQALRAALDECDRWDDLVSIFDEVSPQAAQMRAAITKALEGNRD